jgi:hypothetical protein
MNSKMFSNPVMLWLMAATITHMADAGTSTPVSLSPPTNAGGPLPKSFVSFSIEFAFFPDYAGML